MCLMGVHGAVPLRRGGPGFPSILFMSKSLLSNARILIIDDEPSNVRLLERILVMFGGPAVRSTSDSRQALPLYYEFAPDLILLDLHMPHLDGFALIEQLKAAIPAQDYLPILVLTADSSVETKRRALSAGARDFLTKPLDHLEVVLRIENLLQNRLFHRQLQHQNERLEEQVRERTAQLEGLLNELRSAQENVVRQERLQALGTMAGGIAHDFNNVLSLILGYGEMLQPFLQQHATERERGCLRSLLGAAGEAAGMVNRLREFYRPALSNELRVPVALNDLIEQTLSLTAPRWRDQSRAAGTPVELVTDLQPTGPVRGNASELRSALANLIFNALDAMPSGGRLSVSTQESEGAVLLRVEDTGLGMNEEEQARCLEPFFSTKRQNGTGLGLSVVYGIVQRHDGSIEIRSQVGQGTAVTIRLPLNPGVVSTGPLAEDPDEDDRPMRILVAEDQEVIAELVAEYLRADGHEVVLARDGREALSHFASGSFEMVITDQSMPLCCGEELARSIATIAPEMPVILLTGFRDELLARGGLPEGVRLVLGKPVSAAELRRALRQVRPARAQAAA